MDSRYEEALERCKKEFDFNNLVYSHEEINQKLKRVFPELQNEDERTRKGIIEYLEQSQFGEEHYQIDDDIVRGYISWLENQDEESNVTNVLIKAGLKAYKDGNKWCVLVGDNIQDGVCGFGDTIDEALFEFLKELSEMSKKSQSKSPLELWKDMRFEVYQQASGNRHEPNYSDDSIKMFSLTDIDEIFEKIAENKDEQKPADEPKFKVGDLVRAISSGNIFKILSVNDGLYRVLCFDGVEANYPISEVKEDLAYWTIQNAKDGDVLCGYPTGDYPWIGIFHELNDDNTFKSYCYLQAGITGKFCPPSGVNIFGKRNVDEHNSEVMVPATKEQRDFLFRKMHEAGYEWDAEKKELSKIG